MYVASVDYDNKYLEHLNKSYSIALILLLVYQKYNSKKKLQDKHFP